MARLCDVLVSAILMGVLVSPASAQVDTLRSQQGEITVHPVEHATLVLSGSGRTVYVDPVGDPERFAGLPRPDLILITDIHRDHLDARTVAALATPNTTMVAPQAVADELDIAERGRTTVLSNGSSTTLAGLVVEAVPMYNLTPERTKFHPKGRGNGYLITLAGMRLYVSGDTEDIPEMRALERIDAAFVCMNLPYTMEVEKAADAVRAFKPKVVYPYHYRGAGGALSDVEEFRRRVAEDPGIQVRQLDWYPR